MPFERRLVPPTEMPPDDAHELPLPADLVLLAEQLTDDANHLAACYPPNRLPTSPGEPRKELFPRRATLMLGGSLAAISLVAVLGIATVAAWRRGEVAPPQAAFPQATRPQAVAVQPVGGSVATAGEGAGERPVFVGEFSLPALEGLLDLREDSPDVASVAF